VPGHDANWLYSSMAQVSATVVAIVGGFLTTFGLASGGEYRRTRRRSLALRRELGRLKETAGLAGVDPDERRQLEQRTAERSAELSELEEEAFEQLYQFRLVARGLLALLLLLLAGVVVPLLLLPQNPDGYLPWHRWVVTGGFLVGLLPVVAFIWAVVDPRSYVPPRGWATQGRTRRLRRWLRRDQPWPAHLLPARGPAPAPKEQPNGSGARPRRPAPAPGRADANR